MNLLLKPPNYHKGFFESGRWLFLAGSISGAHDWQERLVRQFFNEKSTAELIEEAYKKGVAEGEKKYNDLKETMKKCLVPH